MATNNFKPFATAANANVMSQTDWEALPALLSGFISGPAKSAQVNKAIRQASFIAAALAQYTANKSGLDVLDDGDLNGFISKMGTAFGKDFQALDATLTALAGLATGANKLPYFTGNDTAAQTDLTSVGRDIIGKNTIADILTYLGLDVVVNGGSQVWLTSSSGKYHIFIGEDGSWGMWDEENSQNVPLSIIGGGTGGNTKQEAQLNLGLGCGLPPIGIPFYWPSAAMPNTVIPEWAGMTFLKLNGATFTAAQYPKLALVWPGLKLTETRGEFIRVADDGRGVDTGRALLSAQGDAMRNLTGNIEGRTAGSIGRIFSNNANGVFSATGEGGNFASPTESSTAPSDRLSNLNLDVSRQVPTANEFRPRNVAFNFLVRAA
ncbi:phage tail protein [Citrobacter sp. BNK-39]|uniref:phage tail protein n=1 Tax=Citrobacter TaxID=544 RepID=UPI0015EA46D1|nr:phage tail protein [Citrobacter freundii]QLR19860.1 phage tail protein [Citrobacter freundii]